MSFSMKLYEKKSLDFVQNIIIDDVSIKLRFRQFVDRVM